jgi:sialic acid synthase SpsE
MEFKLNSGMVLSDFGKPYIVAELNTSHMGKIDTAKEMISTAKEAGCDCVKFQSWSAETLYSKSYYEQNPIAKRFFDKLSFSEEALMELVNYCKSIEIGFASTPYSRREVDFLVNKCEVPYIKIASMDLTNLPFLEYIAKSGTPMVLSTGMGEMDEIVKAVRTIHKAGNQNVCLLHCTSIYPPEISTIRLKNILGLRERFPDCAIGYSDHSIGIEIASAAVALGACMVEKHFTLDNSKIGIDNQMATEPREMAQLVRNCHNVQLALGSEDRIVFSAEIEQRHNMRRSIVATRDLFAGDSIKPEDLDVKRPGTGFSPEKMADLIGNTLLRDVGADTLITDADVEN